MASTYFEIFIICMILLLPFLYETSQLFRYYFKFGIYYMIVSINSIILIPPMMFRPCDVKNLLWASSFCHHISTIVGIKWILRGKEHLEKDQACIIIANHQSSLDILGMFDIWPTMNKCTVVAKRELFFAWPFGLAAWLCGLIFINRMQSNRAREQLCIATSAIKNKKIKLWIFPEGTRRNTGDMHPFKKGAFHVAIDAQIPILPVVFTSYQHFLNDTEKYFNRGNVIITTLPPISTVGLTKDNLDDLIEKTHQQMKLVYHSTTMEIMNEHKLQMNKLNNVDSNDHKILNHHNTKTENLSNDNNLHRLIIDNNDNDDDVLRQYTFLQKHHHTDNNKLNTRI